MKKLTRLMSLLVALAAVPAAACVLAGCDDGPDNGAAIEIERS